MGKLIAKHYPTPMALRQADHTYVSCCDNDSKAWGCWGGKQNGNALRTGQSSTQRANLIAEPDERAGITCYGINGVCHQAANRILSVAGITSNGAPGYWLSLAFYGPYGRPRGIMGHCTAPFIQHDGIKGEAADCLACENVPAPIIGTEASNILDNPDPREQKYLKLALERYRMAADSFEQHRIHPEQDDSELVVGLQLSLFKLMLDFNLKENVMPRVKSILSDTRQQTELKRLKIENDFLNTEMDINEFIELINMETLAFQENAATVLDKDAYTALFDSSPDQQFTLIDSDIAEAAYNKGYRLQT
jgi:hypothetical protein